MFESSRPDSLETKRQQNPLYVMYGGFFISKLFTTPPAGTLNVLLTLKFPLTFKEPFTLTALPPLELKEPFTVSVLPKAILSVALASV